ncbi:pseudouridine synthase [Roseibium sp.]|uniref:pseudouridine synthase n=1 Tax=Roseibium sp. TaxID=1936156 RepID=UPI003A97B3B0
MSEDKKTGDRKRPGSKPTRPGHKGPGNRSDSRSDNRSGGRSEGRSSGRSGERSENRFGKEAGRGGGFKPRDDAAKGPFKKAGFKKNDGPKRGAGKPRSDSRSAAIKQDDNNAPLDPTKGERIAKVMARAGLCSRRDAEVWIANGRVELNGKLLETPAVTVTGKDQVLVDGEPMPTRERTRLWLYHKPRGLVTTNKDPEGRKTVFERLPAELPRVLAVGRLDINTEGLLLLTNDGGLARVLELPATGWLRRYKVRAYGKVTQPDLDTLAEGVAIDGVLYGAIEATLDKEQGDNVWLSVNLREGKNREVKRVLEHLGLTVNRLIRLSFGPFQLMDLAEGEVREIRGRVLRDQLGDKLAEEAGADFDAPIFNNAPAEEAEKPTARAPAGGGRKDGGKRGGGEWMSAKEGASAAYSRKPRRDGEGRGDARADSRRDSRTDTRGDKPFGGQKSGGRKNQGDRQQKVSPRSSFRVTSDQPKRAQSSFDAPPPPQRRIWGEEGRLDDKQQERRTSRDNSKRPPRDGDSRPSRDGNSRPSRDDGASRPFRGKGGPRRGRD